MYLQEVVSGRQTLCSNLAGQGTTRVETNIPIRNAEVVSGGKWNGPQEQTRDAALEDQQVSLVNSFESILGNITFRKHSHFSGPIIRI